MCSLGALFSEQPLSPAHPHNLLPCPCWWEFGERVPLPCIVCCWLQSRARGWCPWGDSAHPCVSLELEPCQLPLRRNIYPFCWSCLLIDYLCRGLVVLGRAESGDVAHSPASQAACSLCVCLSPCSGMAVSPRPSLPCGSEHGLRGAPWSKEGRGQPGGDCLSLPALHWRLPSPEGLRG